MPDKKYKKMRLMKVRRYKNHTTITISYRHPDFKRLRIALRRVSSAFYQYKKVINILFSSMLIMIGICGIAYISRPYIINFAQSQITQDVVYSSSPSINHLPRSIPLQIEIQSINLQSKIVQTDINPDNTLAVPKDYGVVAWYESSPTPGEVGPSILVGHATSSWGDGIFANLSKVKKGDAIMVLRADGDIAEFTVDDVLEFPQDSFPTDKVYGNINYSGLRIITCGGVYNYLTGNYSNNIVVFSSLK